MTKVLNKVEREGSDFNIINVIYEKSTSNIIVISEKMKISLRSRKKARVPILNISINHNIRSPSQGFRLGMETKVFHLERKKQNYVCSQRT